MVVLNKICEKCKYTCNSVYFQRNFANWASGNNDIDRLIQDTQLSAHYDASKALEWVPYNRFANVSYITKDEFGEMYCILQIGLMVVYGIGVVKIG